MNECPLTTFSISQFLFIFYSPIVTNPENNPCIQTMIQITTKIYPIANLP